MKTYRTRRSGFTLVEILIVVIILGILAAIVIPQFTGASQDARKSNLASQVQTLKSQIELYRLQHNETLPALLTDWTQMTEYSDINGANLGTVADLGASPQVNLGPYYQEPPTNPLTQVNKVAAEGSPAGNVGWTFNATTGAIHGVVVSSTGSFLESDDGYHDLTGAGIP
jgi:general secretion pathway protein G